MQICFLRSWKGFLSIFLPSSWEFLWLRWNGPGWSGFHPTNIFIISHSWHQRPCRNSTFTGVCFKLCPPKGVRNNTGRRLTDYEVCRTHDTILLSSRLLSVFAKVKYKIAKLITNYTFSLISCYLSVFVIAWSHNLGIWATIHEENSQNVSKIKFKFKFIYFAGTVHINQHHCKCASVSQKANFQMCPLARS